MNGRIAKAIVHILKRDEIQRSNFFKHNNLSVCQKLMLAIKIPFFKYCIKCQRRAGITNPDMA